MAGFGLNPLDAAIADSETAYSLSPGLVDPTARVAPGLAQQQPDPTAAQIAALNAKEPGRYAAMSPDEFEAFKKKQEESSPGRTRPFSAGVQAGFISNGTMGGNFLQALGVKFDSDTLYSAGKSVQEVSTDSAKGLEPRVGSIADVHSAGDAWDYVKYQTGNAIGSSAPSVVSGVLASFVTSNPVLGMAVGAAAPSYIQNTGDMYGTLRDSPGIAEQVKAGKLTPKQIVDYALVTGVPLAALDILGEVQTLGLTSVLGGAIDKVTLGKLKTSIAGRLAKRVVEGGISEGSTEGMQQVIQESVSEVLGDKTPTGQRVINVLDNAIGGMLGGGAMGGGAHVISSVANRNKPAEAVPDEVASPSPGVAPAAGPDVTLGGEGQPTRFTVRPDPAAAAGQPAADRPAPVQEAAPAAPSAAGPLGRALDRGNAANTAAAAETLVPVGSPVAISMPGVPPMNVTVQGYHADGMDVVDESGEVHTLPMNDPDVTVTPLGGAASVIASQPAAESLPAEAAPAPEVQPVEQPQEAVAPISAEAEPEIAATPKRAEKKAADQAKPAPAKDEDREAKPIPFSYDVAGKKMAFPSDGLAALYGLGQARNSLRQAGRNTGDADKLISTERQRAADLLGIPVDDINVASDEYRHMVEQAAKSGADEAQVAPAFDPKTLTAARDAWNGMSAADRKSLLGRASIKRSPKMEWDALGTTIQNKLKPLMDGPTLEEAAHAAATSPENDLPEPTQAQKEAGNYKLGHHVINGLDLSVENPQGSERKGVDANGKPWAITMQSHYGYIKGTVGFDKDHVDAFVKSGTPNDWNGTVYVVDQNKANGHFDEHKTMIGFDSEAEARAAYSANYAKDWNGLGAVTAMPFDGFKSWVKSDAPKKGALAAAPAKAEKPFFQYPGENNDTGLSKDASREELAQHYEAEAARFANPDGTPKEGNQDVNAHLIATSKEYARQARAGEQFDKDKAIRAGRKEEKKWPGTSSTSKRAESTGDFPAVDPKAKWFSTRDRAEKYAAKQGMADSHEIVQTQKQRFEIRPKAAEQIAENAKKSDASVAKPAENTTPVSAKQESEQEVAREPVEEKPVENTTAAKPSYGASNKLVTAARADEVRAKLRAKLRGQLNAGIDPEVLALGAELAAFHIEAGVRKFADVARAVAKDLDVNVSAIRKYVRAWYNGARDMMEDSGHDVAGMDSPETVRAQVAALNDPESENELGSGAETDRAPASPEVGGGDRDGVREPEGAGSRDGAARQDAAQVHPEKLGDGEPQDVGEPQKGRTPLRGQAGVRAAREDVGAVRQSGEGRDEHDGRAADSRRGQPDARTGAGSRTGSVASVDAAGTEKRPDSVSPADAGPGDFQIDDPRRIAGGGPVARFEKNKSAIELRNSLLDLGVKPTREQQEILAGYTGWGSFGQELFQGSWNHPKPKVGWEVRDTWLRDNLGQEEWEGLQRSIINAHYTDPPTVGAMWNMVSRAGFTGGRVLEPSIGIGNFFGMMPADLASRSKRAGIELDPVTGSMAQMLYPDANIQIKGFEESKTPDGFYDLVIGNWPFANIKPADRRYNRLGPSLHDYFFLKALDQTRAGGLVVGITSASTMDKKDSAVRAEMARKGELVAAFRLPSGAFEEYAGTKVVTDIIVLRKRSEPAGIVANEGWIKSVDMDTKAGEKVSVNEYYHAHPENVIGQIDYGHGTTFARPGMIVHRPNDMEQQLRRIVEMVPEGSYHADTRGKQISYVANNTGDRTGALVKADDGFRIVQGEHLARANDVKKYQVKNAAENVRREAQLSSLIDMRKLYGSLLDAQRDGDAVLERKALHDAYKAFTKEHGSVSESFGLRYLKDISDPFYASMASLERRVEGKKGSVSYEPAAVLTENTVRGAKRIENPSTADAFVLARNESVDPSPARIAEIASKPEAEVRRELIDNGAAFEGPSGQFIPADIYLSGNVREKLRQAQAALEQGNKAMQHNIEALQKVMPADVPYFKIETQMGATWVPPKLYGEYIAHMLGMPNADKIDVKFQNGSWKVDFPGEFNNRAEARSGFGMESDKGRFKRLVRAALANQNITIKGKDSDGNEYVDGELTKEANEKIAIMRMRFGEWLWQDPTRRVEMEREYNEVRNAYANPSYDGSFLSFPGMALSLGRGPFDLRQHQVNAIWRALVTRKSLNAHEVGTGKTFTMGGIAVESRRYGIAKKPMILAHNANSKSVAAEIQMMYPAAKLLYVDNLSSDNIKTRMMQIANDDWDAIVIPHSLIDRIGFKEETLRAMAQEDLDALEREAIEAAKEEGGTITEKMWEDEEELKKLRAPTAKDLVKQRLRIINQIKKLAQRSSREDSIAFEDLGVDQLLVDEAHEFKKPPIATKMRMKGLQTQTSDRSIALMFLTKYIRGMNNGANVHLFTGTPITNTLTEVFHQMRYIMNEEMAQTGLADWDGWFGSFAREVNDVELSSTGEYEPVTRLQAFINVPELRRMIGQYMDVVFSDDMPEMRPREVNGKTMADKSLTDAERAELLNGRTENAMDRPYKKVENSSSDMSPEQSSVFEYVQALAREWRQMGKKDRREAMRRGDPTVPIIYDNMAEKASFDVRLVNAIENAGKEGAPEMEPHPDSKPARAVRNIIDIYRSDLLANQVVFMEQGMHKTVTRSEGEPGAKTKQNYKAFSTMQDMIERLVQGGVPRDEIAVVTGAISKDKRKEVADGMNTGRYRVVFGSTDSLGVGVNMQRNLRAMHHLDAPWMPGDLEQRNGRGQRQGNQWNTVLEHRYLTDKLDGRRWQVLAIKQKFISEFLKSDDSVRVIEGDAASDEQSDILSTFSEAAGDPRVLIREKLKKKIEQLQSRERTYLHGKEDAKREAASLRKRLPEHEQRLAEFNESGVAKQAADLMDAQRGDGFTMTLGSKTFENRKDANEATRNLFLGGEIAIGEDKQIGVYGGVPLFGQWGRFASKPDLYVKIGNEVARSEGPSLGSLESAIRSLREQRGKKLAANVEDIQRSLAHNEAVSQEPFHFADRLDDTKRQLADLENDIAANPVAPPYWLRAGAPTETEVHAGGKPYTVTGHRWTDDGYFVLAQDGDGKAIAIPYMEANDKQGMPLYEEHRFSSPKPVEEVKAEDRKESVPAGEPVAKLTGDEVGVSFKGPHDMPALRRAAQSWYDQNLVGTTATMADGTEVRFNKRGMRESTHGRKGDILLRSIPAIRDIIEHGSVVHREPGNRPHVLERVVVAAPVEMDGVVRRLAVSIHKTADGRFQYDFTMDREAKGPGDGVPGGLTESIPRRSAGESTLGGENISGDQVNGNRNSMERIAGIEPTLEGWKPSALPTELYPQDGLNLFELPAGYKAGTGMSSDEVRSAIGRSPLSGPLGALIDAGKVVIEPAADSAAEAYTAADGTIHLVAPNLSPDAVMPAVLHEAFHSGGQALLGGKVWGDLLGRLRGLYNQARRSQGGARAVYDKALARMENAQAASGAFSEALTPEEFGAYVISEHETMPRAFAAWARDVIGAVKAWALRRFGRQIGAVTPEQLRALAVAAVRDGAVGSTAQTGRRESVPQQANVAMPRTAEELSSVVKGLSEDARGPALSLLPLNVMTDWAAPNQVAVQQYIDMKRRMDTYRNKKQNTADGLVQKWRKAVGKGGKNAAPLASVMHEATLMGFDPARPDDGWRSDPIKVALMKRYQALTPNARAVYEEVRDAYKAEADERDKIILDNVSKAMDQEIRNAERARDRELARIRDEGLDGTEKKEAIEAAETKFKRAQQKLKFSKKARLAALRAAFETNRVPEPYFPLARFGQYFVTARNDVGKVISFSRAETKAQLDRVVRDLRKQMPHASIETGLLEDKGSLRGQMDPRVLADIQAILGNAGVSDEVMDQVWQRYLEAMPDLSIRKSSIHRGGVAGFNTDAMRAFASHMFHSAHQMGRMKFGGDLLEITNEAVDQAKKAGNPISAMKVANELRKRHEWVMNPTNSSWANAATTAGFLYFLGASPASAAVNLSQTAIMGVPILGSRFGMGKTTAALAKASRDFVGGKGSVETSRNLTDLEKTAIADLYERGALDKSLSHDLAGIADRGAGYNPTRQRVMQAMAFMFHHAERFNREVTALAAYRLARQAGMSHGVAVDKAGELTWLTHFDYSNTNRPRVMQHDAAKVALLFKNFQINMIYRLFRDTQQAFAGDTPQARKEARYQLAGIMGMYALMAGGLGVPLMKQIIIPLWKMLFGKEPDKSADEEFRDAVLNTLGPQLGGVALDGVPGYVTGTAITKRIGMADLWFQSDDREQDAKDWWNSLTNDMLGPVWGMAHNVYNGFNVVRDGKGVARGVEMVMPTAAKNMMKAWRYSQEGVVNMRGDTVVSPESLGMQDALKQALGFTPATVAEQYTRNNEKSNIDKRIGQQRKKLLDAFAQARKSGDEDAVAAVLADIQKFNEEPGHAPKRITAKTIRESVRTRARLSGRAENGVIIQNKRQNAIINESLPPRVY